MKRFFAAIALTAFLGAFSSNAEAPDAAQQQLLALVKEVQTQQAQIADNQSKMEAKLADVAETIRVARIFAGKAGK